MTQPFAAMRTRGPAWNESVPMEQQVDWRAHADFMNALHADGVALLVFRTGSAAEVAARLAEDCWSVKNLLQTLWIKPWALRLGTVPGPQGP
ncbi:MAG: hypothetical protein J0J01_32440 [Reyranella sp.]|uniref:hypothetical protein n=1 Tax=Reyranella sp. TaxID=1929291 RepID=UPI001ACEC598|nr:hypothetical protein [Reyranella sp.]MBN9091654.1 hypothetical protein [Reyranella sp.]